MFEALNKLRDALLAAKNGEEVDEILNGLFTYDERMKIGRRIMIAEQIKAGLTLEEIINLLHVGKNTISSVNKSIETNPHCFELIEKRGKKVQREYDSKKYNKVGGSKLIYKKKTYSGITKKNVKR